MSSREKNRNTKEYLQELLGKRGWPWWDLAIFGEDPLLSNILIGYLEDLESGKYPAEKEEDLKNIFMTLREISDKYRILASIENTASKLPYSIDTTEEDVRRLEGEYDVRWTSVISSLGERRVEKLEDIKKEVEEMKEYFSDIEKLKNKAIKKIRNPPPTDYIA
jgi:hypothetical protein